MENTIICKRQRTCIDYKINFIACVTFYVGWRIFQKFIRNRKLPELRFYTSCELNRKFLYSFDKDFVKCLGQFYCS